MQVFALTFFILGLSLTESSPVAKKVEKRTAIESIKADISPKLFNPKDDPENFKPRSLQFDELKAGNIKDGQKDEKMQGSKDLKEEKKDDLRPEDDSESLDVDREKKSCKTVKTAPPPPTKICLEISNAPSQVEICEDDPPPRPEIRPQEPPQINIETQPVIEYHPVFQVPQFHIEEPQTVYIPPPPPPPQPSTICFETYTQPQVPQLPVFSVPQPQIPQFPQISPASIVPGPPQFVPPTVIRVESQPQFGNPQTLPEWHRYHKQLHKLHLHLPHQLHDIIHGTGTHPTFGRPPSQFIVPGGVQLYPTPNSAQFTTCSCKVGGSPNGLVVSGGNQGPNSSPGNIVVKPVGPSGPGTITVTGDGQARNSGGLMYNGPMMARSNQLMKNQPMMMPQSMTMQHPMMMSSQISGPARAMDVSWGPMTVQGLRHVRGESGSPPNEHAHETGQKSHPQSSGKEEQSTQISLNPSSSSSPMLRISTPHQSSQTIYSPNNFMTDKSKLNEDNMNLRNIEIQGQGMQPFLLGRSRQHLKEENLAVNARYEDLDGM